MVGLTLVLPCFTPFDRLVTLQSLSKRPSIPDGLARDDDKGTSATTLLPLFFFGSMASRALMGRLTVTLPRLRRSTEVQRDSILGKWPGLLRSLRWLRDPVPFWQRELNARGPRTFVTKQSLLSWHSWPYMIIYAFKV